MKEKELSESQKEEISFNPMDEPEQCPLCHDHPAWDEIADGQYECRNCDAIIDSKGNIIKEPDQDDKKDEDLYDD